MIRQHSFLFIVLTLLFAACEKSKPAQKDIPEKTAPPAELVEPVQDMVEEELTTKEIPDTELGFLVTYENKYARQEDLFKNEVFANRLKQIDRFNYDALLQFYNTETPIVIIDNIVHMSGCKQHSCPDNAYDFFIDLTNDNINIYYFRSNMLRIYKEKEMIELPDSFAEEMEIKKSNAKIGEVSDTESTYNLTDGQ
jgi:hypothetical protein